MNNFSMKISRDKISRNMNYGLGADDKERNMAGEWKILNKSFSGEQQEDIDTRGRPILFISIKPEAGVTYDYEILEGAIPGYELVDDEYVILDSGTGETSPIVVRSDKAGGVVRIKINTGDVADEVVVRAISH